METTQGAIFTILLTNHLSLVMDHHGQVLKDLVYIQDIRLKYKERQKKTLESAVAGVSAPGPDSSRC